MKDELPYIVLVILVVVAVGAVGFMAERGGFQDGVERVCFETNWQSKTCVKEKERRMGE